MPKFRGETIASLIAKRSVLRPGSIPSTGAPHILKRVPNIRGNYWAVRAKFAASDKVPGGQSEYDTVLVFHNIEFEENKSSKCPFKTTALGHVYYMTIPQLSKTMVRLSCTCADYYWTWWYYNKKYNALSGVDLPHPTKVTGLSVRQTDGKPYGSSGIGERNTAHKPGICKHINSLANELVAEGRVKK